MNDNQRPVLLVSYDWPPSAEVGAVRVQKLARHLCEHGWKPIILTVKESYYERIFNEKVSSEFLMLRTRCVPSPLKAYAYSKKVIGNLKAPMTSQKQDTKGTDGKASQGNKSPFYYARRLILSMLYMPDEFLGWLPLAVLKGVSAIKTHRISHVITSGPPFTTHLVGLAMKKWKGKHIKWVADFRDPWVANEQRTELVTTSLSNYFNQVLEKQVITYADTVVCVTPSMTDWYRKRYPLIADSVWQTITNGFEQEEFNRVDKEVDQRKFTISYIGSIEYERNPVPLLQAVADLCREGVLDKQRVSIRLIGKCGSVQGRPTTELIRECGLEGVVELVGFVSRAEALKEMKAAHVLLLLANAQGLQVPGKAYEYIAAGSFIVAVTEEHGATADLVKRVGGGAIVQPSDHRAMKRILQNRYENFASQCTGHNMESKPLRSTEALNEYEWSHLGARYAGILR